LGLVLALAFVACSGGGGGGGDDPEKSSSSNGGGGYVPPEESPFIGLDVDISESGSKVYILGSVEGTDNNPIESVDFIPANWVNYTGSTTGVTVLLGGKTTIDLTNSAIPCKDDNKIQVKACVKVDGKVCKDCCATSEKTFKKPQSYCNSSSSTTVVSSSSVAMWKFGNWALMDMPDGSAKTISGFGASILLESRLENGAYMPYIVVSNGELRVTGLPEIGLFATDDGYPEVGKGYELKYLEKNPENNILTGKGASYIVSSGSKKYLIRIEAKNGDEGDFDLWPKQIRYWEVTESPNI